MSQLSFTANSCILPQNSYILSKTLPVIYASHLTLKLTQPNSFSNPEHEKPLSTTLPKVIHISRWLSEDGQLFTRDLATQMLLVCLQHTVSSGNISVETTFRFEVST